MEPVSLCIGAVIGAGAMACVASWRASRIVASDLPAVGSIAAEPGEFVPLKRDARGRFVKRRPF